MEFVVESVDINIRGHMSRVQGEKFWTYAASEWHRLYRSYVPFKEGILYNTVNITGGNGNGIIEHTVPYAHYAYEGLVYGPNVPIVQGGQVVGFFSPTAPKHPTGKMLHYSGMGSRHWDEAAKPTMFPLLINSLQGFVDSGALGFVNG